MRYLAPEAEIVSFDNGYLAAVASNTVPSIDQKTEIVTNVDDSGSGNEVVTFP